MELGEEQSGVLECGHSFEMPDVSHAVMFLPAEARALVQQFSPAALAYVGDAVYELYVRASYLVPPKRLQDYHEQVVFHVRAETQAIHLKLLQPYLTDAEQEILRRGRNAATQKTKRVPPKTYQEATSLETLLGYLYITNPGRLFQLLDQISLDRLSQNVNEERIGKPREKL